MGHAKPCLSNGCTKSDNKVLLLVTLCTNRKKRAAPSTLQARNLPIGPQEWVFAEWRRRILSCTERQPAMATYCGRGFTEALLTARVTMQPLWIISAGLGLITAEDVIPAYDLTLNSASPNSIRSRTLPLPFRPEFWWQQLNQLYAPTRSLARLVQENPHLIVVVTLSSAYIQLVTSDLISVPPVARDRVRLVGPVAPQGLSSVLQPLWMPYDARFDGPNSPNPGTRADFPQRVARHFVEQIAVRDPVATPAQHRAWVTEALATLLPASIPRRRPLDDDAILTLIAQCWDRAGGSAARMLRWLRDKEGVACEQGRLARLFKQVKQQGGMGGGKITSIQTSNIGDMD